MNQKIILLIVFGIILVAGMFILPEQTQALPEYSPQTGEPCASCHLSPSGGGARGVRGQAWVGGGRPGAVPGLIEALELLGVHLEIDEKSYQKTPGDVPPAQPLGSETRIGENLLDWLGNYDGN